MFDKLIFFSFCQLIESFVYTTVMTHLCSMRNGQFLKAPQKQIEQREITRYYRRASKHSIVKRPSLSPKVNFKSFDHFHSFRHHRSHFGFLLEAAE